jgi:Sensors of blue-light using FAD
VRTAEVLQLVYASTATALLTAEGLERIVEASARRNKSAGLTGLLLHQGTAFYGVLEGSRRRVLQRMELIVADRRHHGLCVLREELVSTRRFDNWSFGSLPSPATKDGSDEFILTLCGRL